MRRLLKDKGGGVPVFCSLGFYFFAAINVHDYGDGGRFTRNYYDA
jgi:hypothetical protein